MRSTEVIRLIAARELTERARMKSFKISTVVLAVGLLAVVLVPQLMDDGPASYDIGVVGRATPALEASVQSAGAAVDAEVTLVEVQDQRSGERRVADGGVDALVVPVRETVVDEELDPESKLSTLVSGLNGSLALTAGLERAGVAPQAQAEVLSSPPLPVRALGGAEEGADQKPVTIIGGIILYIFLLTYGGTVAVGVVEEKASRVVEVLLSAVRPHQLLAGKVLGIAVLGIGQAIMVVVPALALAVTTGTDLPSGTPATVASLLLWFLLGYALYSCAYAAAGSLVSRVEDAQNGALPITMILLVGYGAAISAWSNADTLLVKMLALLPPTAPLVMPTRAALGATAPWEVPLAVALTLLSTYALIRLAGRIYVGAVLRFGGRVSLRQALRGGEAAPMARS